MKLIVALVVLVGVFTGNARAKCVSGDTVSKDDDISVAKCPDNLTVAECKCVPESEGAYCDGATVTADLKTCNVHGAGSGGKVKAAACCTNAQQTLASNPPIMAESGKSVGDRAKQYKEPATVTCPDGKYVKQCLLHTFWSHNYADKHMKASVVGGRKCVTPTACKQCGVQAICTGDCQAPSGTPATASKDDAISVAKCPGNSVVVACSCKAVSKDAYCDGVTVTADMKTCNAHGAGGGGSVTADVCCADARQTLASNPPIMAESGKSVGDRAKQYEEPATVECPAGQYAKQCLLHTFWSHTYKDKHMKATADGRKCATPAACKKCGVQAICTAFCTAAPIGKTVSRDDAISVAKCPGDSVVTDCKCIPESKNAYCDGVTVTADMKTCNAHGAGSGGSVKAMACCANAKQTLASNPPIMAESGKSVGDRSKQYEEPATVECPAGQYAKQCLLHTFWSHGYADKHMKATANGRKCVTPAACKRCGVQAICG